MNEDNVTFWADVQTTLATTLWDQRQWCRVAVSDITALKRAEEAEQHMALLSASNRELEQEVARRRAAEEALRQSEQHQSRLLEESREMQEQLRHLSHRILQAQEEERKRISRELHDDIAQTLTGINVHLEALNREVAHSPASFKRRLRRTQRLVEKSVNSVQRFVRELRPTVLDDLGLIPALHSYLKEFMKQTGIRVFFSASVGVEQLNSALRLALYRIAQESLTNVARHARATRVNVTIQHSRPDAVLIEIKDNGKSFHIERVLRARKHQHLGLLGMRERVEMAGGSLTIESTPGRGTVIQALIPISHGARG
jgi:signal transduction histidine kinase